MVFIFLHLFIKVHKKIEKLRYEEKKKCNEFKIYAIIISNIVASEKVVFFPNLSSLVKLMEIKHFKNTVYTPSLEVFFHNTEIEYYLFYMYSPVPRNLSQICF